MLSEHDNAQLTQIGPGTPMGTLQRRYWHVVGPAGEMATRWTRRVKLLGEELVLFKDRSGRFGLIAEQCPHRRASFAYGIPEADGIRCPYHGWKFDHTGQCVDQPNEPEGSTFKDKCATTAYSVEEMGGLLWAYLGPQPAPFLPRWDGLAGDGKIRTCAFYQVRANWLQIMENSLDPIHTQWLHGALLEFLEEASGLKVPIAKKQLKIAFDEFEFGIYKRRLVEGQTEDADDWKIGHPVIFPNMLAVGSGGGNLWKVHSYQLRVPMDDESTMHYWYWAFEPPEGADVPAHLLDQLYVAEMPVRDERGHYVLDTIGVQDVMAWETQGLVARRDLERLGTTDEGIIAYRQMLKRELAKVLAGEDPMGTLRDPARNTLIQFPIERDKSNFTDGFDRLVKRSGLKCSPIVEDLRTIFKAFNGAKLEQALREAVGAGTPT
jgi:5,5'-dehydrodivanillate O-demethylase oxygenase subunit